MGGTEKECDDKGPPVKSKEDVSEAIISKLLKDFNSAALLKGSVASNPDLDAADESAGCEEISSSLKHLHLRKPANSRQKFKERRAGLRKGKTSGNKYNLSVAAVNVQRPVVWPGKLNNASKDDLPVLHPPKLSLSTKEESLADRNSASSIKSASAVESSKIEPEVKRYHVRQFGSLSESKQEHLSFSHLSEKYSKLDSPSDTATGATKSAKCTPPSSSLSIKRPNSCHFPVAKHPRLYNEIHVSSDIAQFLDFRCPSSDEDNINTNSLSPPSRELHRVDVVHESSSSNKDDLRSGEISSSSLNATSASCERPSSSQESAMDEANVNELASYFDDFLHIPKKMSVMAEMMYA